jgi:hypothetical protein
MITKISDEVCCGHNRSSGLLNNLEVELVEGLQSQRNLGDMFGQRSMQQVMTKNVPEKVP